MAYPLPLIQATASNSMSVAAVSWQHLIQQSSVLWDLNLLVILFFSSFFSQFFSFFFIFWALWLKCKSSLGLKAHFHAGGEHESSLAQIRMKEWGDLFYSGRDEGMGVEHKSRRQANAQTWVKLLIPKKWCLWKMGANRAYPLWHPHASLKCVMRQHWHTHTCFLKEGQFTERWI